MLVETDDLIDAHEVARLMGLSHRNSVSSYLHKYPDMPGPAIDLGLNRPRLWLRQDIEGWLQCRGPVRPGRRRAGVSTSSENVHPPSGGVEVARGGRKPPAAQGGQRASVAKKKSSGLSR